MSERVQLTVTGMTCSGCENAVKRTLTLLPGVEDVSASHQRHAVDVTFDPVRVTQTMLRASIEALGYRVTT